MPKIDSHPVRISRIAAGFSMRELADRAGITRATLAAIEDGRTQHPDDETLAALAGALGLGQAWTATVRAFQIDARTRLDARGALAVSLPASAIGQLESFRDWRLRVAATPNGYASLTGVHRMVVSNYERSLAGTPMPEKLMHSLFTLGMDAEQALALSRLPPGGRS